MSDVDQAFAHALCQKACLQVIYAQAQRRYNLSANKATSSPSKGAPTARQPRAPLPPSSIYVVEKVSETLTDVVVAFIQQVARSSMRRARHASRSHCNFLDVISALNAMSPATQSTVRDIARYSTFQSIAFPMPVPDFPLLPSETSAGQRPDPRSALRIPSEDVSATRARPYIESWMPPIPSAHTFVSNPGILSPPGRPAAHAAGPEQRRRVEMSLERLRDAAFQSDPPSQPDSQPMDVANMHGSGLAVNPFTSLPKVATSATSLPDYPTGLGLDEPLREPLEEDDHRVDTNANLNEVPKYSISDQKRARVDRILAESGTIMLGNAAGGSQPDSAGGSATPSTPMTDIPAMSPKSGGGT